MSNSTFSELKVNALNTPINNLVGNGSVVIGGLVNVRFTIVKGAKGVFASLPSRKGNKPDETGKIPYYPEVSIVDKGMYEEFQQIVKKEFAKLLGAKSNGGGKTGNGKQNKSGEEDQTEAPDTYLF